MLTMSPPGIDKYAEDKTSPVAELLDELERETHASMKYPQMLCGRLEGSFLRLMVQVTNAKSILEIGMFTGYSALSMASALPADGKITTLEIEPLHVEMGRKYFKRSEFGDKIEIKEGPALESMSQLSGPFDLVFIDADKLNYSAYYEAVLPKVRTGGVILADNVLWGGAVLNPTSAEDRAIVAFNDLVMNDSRVEQVLLTIRDGVLFIRKK